MGYFFSPGNISEKLVGKNKISNNFLTLLPVPQIFWKNFYCRAVDSDLHGSAFTFLPGSGSAKLKKKKIEKVHRNRYRNNYNFINV